MRVIFFLALVLTLALNALALFIGRNGILDIREGFVLIALILELFVVGVMVIRGKVFKTKGRWIYVTTDEDDKQG